MTTPKLNRHLNRRQRHEAKRRDKRKARKAGRKTPPAFTSGQIEQMEKETTSGNVSRAFRRMLKAAQRNYLRRLAKEAARRSSHA